MERMPHHGLILRLQAKQSSTADFFVSWVIYYSETGVVNKLKRGFRTYLRYIRVTTNGANTKTILIYLRKPSRNKLLTKYRTH
jgi:hypothetical protein